MNNLVPTRVNPDYYYHDKKIGDSHLIFNSKLNDSNNQEELKFVKKKKFIVISSLDRDWYNNSAETNPFNYTVKLADSGFFTLQDDLKNIVSIKIERMMLPNKSLYIEYSENKSTISNEPYLLVELKNISSPNDGTNSQKNNVFGIMNTNTAIAKNGEVNYLEFKNANNSMKEFYNPISNITNFNVLIKNQLSRDPFTINDILTIDTIYSSGNESETLDILNKLFIKTTTLFNNQYQIGDILQIQGYTFRDTSYSEATNFNNFINRSEGHKIIDLKNSNYSYHVITQSGTTITQYQSGNTDYNDRNFLNDSSSFDVDDKIIVYEDGTTAIATYASGTTLTSSISKTITSPEKIYIKPAAGLFDYYDTIAISIPYTISSSSIANETWWTSLKSKSSTEDNSSSSGDTGGKLINTYLQSHLFINVEYLEYENSVSSQLI